MTEVIFSSRLWQHWLEVLFIGSNPRDGGEAGYMLRTVWDWYGLRENITSLWTGVSMSAINPCSSPWGLLAKKVPRAFHLQCHVDYTAGRAERRLLITFALTCWLSFTFSLSFWISLWKSELSDRKQARYGHFSRFQLPTRLNTSVRTCQGQLK